MIEVGNIYVLFSIIIRQNYIEIRIFPENAWLTDIGVDFRRSVTTDLTLRAKADAFLNLLTDKIISAPTEYDPAIWAPYNIGKVRSAGLDAIFGISYVAGDLKVSFDARYSYQSAVDVTPDSYSFGQQIPYVARHTVVLNAMAAWRGWTVAPVWQMRAGRMDGYGELPDWNTLDLNMSKAFSLPRTGPVALKLTVKNIFDCRYETVSGYPMPGRSVMGGIEYVF